MKLSAYLKQTGESDAQFGARAGVHRTRVWSYRTGRLSPGLGIAARIVKATDGAVGFVDLAPKPKRPVDRRVADRRRAQRRTAS